MTCYFNDIFSTNCLTNKSLRIEENANKLIIHPVFHVDLDKNFHGSPSDNRCYFTDRLASRNIGYDCLIRLDQNSMFGDEFPWKGHIGLFDFCIGPHHAEKSDFPRQAIYPMSYKSAKTCRLITIDRNDNCALNRRFFRLFQRF